MARTRKTDNQVDNTNDQSNVQKPTRKKREKKALSKAQNKFKRAQSESSPRKRRRLLEKKHTYDLRSSNSVILVSEVPCCASEEDRKKFARLGLDSALFCTSSRPAKRKQSHISVITISSGDDVMSMDRTAEWVATMDLDNEGHLGEEDTLVEGMNITTTTSESKTVQVSEAEDVRQQMSLLQIPTSGHLGEEDTLVEGMNITTNATSESKTVEVSEAEDVQQQMSLLQIPTSPKSTFQPLCVSTPGAMTSCRLPETMEMESLPRTVESTNLTQHTSFLVNPSNTFSVNMTNLKSPHTLISCDGPSQQNMNESTVQVTPRFYFGPPQASRDVWIGSGSYLQQNHGNNSMTPIMSDFVISGINHMSSGFSGQSSSNEAQGQRFEIARQRNLFQIPSTSKSPVFDPIYEHKSDDSSKSEPK